MLTPTSPCRSCRAPVYWATTVAGVQMPLDPESVDDGNVTIELFRGLPRAVVGLAGQPTLDEAPRYVAHFVTCPHASQWRSR